ncbi:DUF6946 family protein [Maricaulis sp.]|uniref:DUF6946 family protein n=1 Tax=Maricaulis sp. TaxID=1486257 RepID=UPI002B272791|nr:hypothetical protein [Maricaulis sp.]
MRNCIYRPTAGPNDWKAFLAKPDLHWKTGRSARSMAHSWEESGGCPPEVSTCLQQMFEAQPEPLFVVPEHQVDLPGGKAASQNDAFLLCAVGDELAAVMVEGKVDETFGPTLGEWLVDASPGKRVRLEALRSILKIDGEIEPDLRYQLFHRTASAVIEARRFRAGHAVCLIHSFSPTARWREDFERFARCLGATSIKSGWAQVPGHTNPTLHLAWVAGEARYLQK